MGTTNYIAHLKLTNFIDARVMELEDNDGNFEQCVVIPIEKNALRVTDKNNVYCDMFVNSKTYDTGDNLTHFFKLKTTHEHVAKLDELGYKTPYLGGMAISKYDYQFKKYDYSKIGKKVKNIE